MGKSVGTRPKLESLQGCRAAAALLVVCFHASVYIESLGARVAPLNGFFEFGHSGVIFFFVLSGFIIAQAHRDDVGNPSTLPRYAVRRFVRVYPIYWVVLVLLLVAATVLGRPIQPMEWRDFLLVGDGPVPALTVAWTLFHEILFYALFGLLLVHRAFAVLLAIWIAVCAAGYLVPPSSYALAPVNSAFGWGLLVAVLPRRFPLSALPLGAALFLLTGLDEVYLGLLSRAGSEILYGLGSACVIGSLVSRESRQNLKIPKSIVVLGDASYALYLIHYPAISISGSIVQGYMSGLIRHPFVLFLAFVIGCCVAALVFHLLVEKPLIRWTTQRLRPAQALSRESDARK